MDDREPQYASMQQVVVEKDRLLTQLRTNREAHRDAFEEALDGYWKRSIELLEQHIELIRHRKVERVQVILPIPTDHTADYDAAIANLEWTVHDLVELTEREFRTYVLDEWNWKQEFVGTNSMYNASS